MLANDHCYANFQRQAGVLGGAAVLCCPYVLAGEAVQRPGDCKLACSEQNMGVQPWQQPGSSFAIQACIVCHTRMQQARYVGLACTKLRMANNVLTSKLCMCWFSPEF